MIVIVQRYDLGVTSATGHDEQGLHVVSNPWYVRRGPANGCFRQCLYLRVRLRSTAALGYVKRDDRRIHRHQT